MGDNIFIKDRRVCVKPLWSRLEAIQKLKHPIKVKGYRSFVEISSVYFVLNYKKILKPIYDLTRKGKQFIWGEEQQSAFEEIKCR